ncbi:TPA: leucine-rich repeat domain-containing protein [Pseudomonas putida]|nr:leucine-rich repeat domain-containing protein [Pseudomonas putida]
MPNSTFSPHSADALIARGLPAWLTNASLERLGTLHESQQRQQQLQQRLHDSLARITPVAAFAQPLLQQALQAQHQFNLDVRQAQLRRSVLQRFPSYIAHIPDALRRQVYQHSLLQSALHNFTEADTFASGLVPRADVLDGDGKVCAISASAFFKLCRSLDVGGQYQRYLQAHLVPGGEADSLIAQAARTNLEAALRLSLVNGEIAEQAHGHCAPLLALCATGAALPAWVRPMQLRVFGQKVRGAVAFEIAHQPADGERCEGVLCWIPDDPEGPLTWYASWGVLYQTLGKQFRLPGYVEFFQRFIGERDREAYTRALANALSKLAADAPVMLDGRHEDLDLSGNQLGELPAAVEQLAQLSNLDLSFNRISVLDDRIAQLSNLESLHLRGNVLVSLPGSLGQLTGLRTLDLGGNRLTTVPANLNQLGRLTQLSLYDNLITLDAEGQSRLEWFSRLEVLGLGRNPLGAAPQLRFNVHLRFVSLRATGLRRVPLRLLQSYPDMIVDLRENRIATLSAEAMEWIEAHPWAADLAQNHLSEATMARIHEALMRLREEQAREDQQPEPSMKSPSRGG